MYILPSQFSSDVEEGRFDNSDIVIEILDTGQIYFHFN